MINYYDGIDYLETNNQLNFYAESVNIIVLNEGFLSNIIDRVVGFFRTIIEKISDFLKSIKKKINGETNINTKEIKKDAEEIKTVIYNIDPDKLDEMIKDNSTYNTIDRNKASELLNLEDEGISVIESIDSNIAKISNAYLGASIADIMNDNISKNNKFHNKFNKFINNKKQCSAFDVKDIISKPNNVSKFTTEYIDILIKELDYVDKLINESDKKANKFKEVCEKAKRNIEKIKIREVDNNNTKELGDNIKFITSTGIDSKEKLQYEFKDEIRCVKSCFDLIIGGFRCIVENKVELSVRIKNIKKIIEYKSN